MGATKRPVRRYRVSWRGQFDSPKRHQPRILVYRCPNKDTVVRIHTDNYPSSSLKVTLLRGKKAS